jgi:hypothetical protein
MKKLIPLMVGMALTFGAVTAFSRSSSTPQKATKATKKKATKSTH